MPSIIPFDIEIVNNQLIQAFGKTHEGKPKFRLVWAFDQTEHRRCFGKNGIQYLYPQVEEVKKYDYLPNNVWVLERWIYHNNPEVVAVEGGGYEPVWAFFDKFGKPYRPFWKVVSFVARSAERGVEKHLTPKDFEIAEREEIDKEIAEFEEMLGETGTDYGNQSDAFVKPMFVDSQKVFKG